MVFNIEPAIYLDHVSGLRCCDMVAVGKTGIGPIVSKRTGYADAPESP
jgi:Xaa-Pro aminopeptidase